MYTSAAGARWGEGGTVLGTGSPREPAAAAAAPPPPAGSNTTGPRRRPGKSSRAPTRLARPELLGGGGFASRGGCRGRRRHAGVGQRVAKRVVAAEVVGAVRRVGRHRVGPWGGVHAVGSLVAVSELRDGVPVVGPASPSAGRAHAASHGSGRAYWGHATLLGGVIEVGCAVAQGLADILGLGEAHDHRHDLGRVLLRDVLACGLEDPLDAGAHVSHLGL